MHIIAFDIFNNILKIESHLRIIIPAFVSNSEAHSEISNLHE